jgi:hypothetical protein
VNFKARLDRVEHMLWKQRLAALTGEKLEAMACQFDRDHPDVARVIKQMTDAELKAMLAMRPAEAAAFVNMRLSQRGEYGAIE